MDSFKSALQYLYTQLPMFQRTGPAAYKHTLGNTLHLDAMYGHPHKYYKTIHVAGTNGKGSVSHMLAAILQSAGYKTGLYTSPHLKDFRERIKIDGEMISEEFVAEWTSDFQQKNLKEKLEPSFFELTVLMAFDYFAIEKADIAVIETGMGGRLDSTNIIKPLLSVITNISYDHMALLGNTLPNIAEEKAGIIKPGVPVVISQRQPEVEQVFICKAEDSGSSLFFADDEFESNEGLLDMYGNQVFNFRKNGDLVFPDLKCDLAGIYQRLNIPAVLKSVELLNEIGLKLSSETVFNGLANVKKLTGLQGRWQTLGANPRIVCDTGHNEAGIKQVTEQIRRTPYRKLHFVLGVVADKDPDAVLSLLPKDAVYYFCKADIQRAMPADVLKVKAAAHNLTGEAYHSVLEAFNAAKLAAHKDDFIFVGGSTFVVAEIL